MSQENLFGDLIEIAAGNVSVATERLNQFRDYANTVPASVQSATQLERNSGGDGDRAPAQDSDSEDQKRAR
jgi:hypothetical protein